MSWQQWELAVQRATERYLSWRKRRRKAKKERQRRKNPVVDWIDAILSAVVIVLLINQYLLQAYQIPSSSMEPTLLVTDRIFVNKLVYGPELVPGMLKLPGFRQPQRADIIIFESPEYLPVGPVKDILQRIVYMVTLSLVDIDRDASGQPKRHFLVKRAIGMPGDRVRMREGNVEIMTPNSAAWIPEAKLKEDLGFSYPNVRKVLAEQYPHLQNAAVAAALEKANLPVSQQQQSDFSTYYQLTRDATGNAIITPIQFADDIEADWYFWGATWAIDPSNLLARQYWREREEGTWLPQDRLFPMGDNRDNSRDARYFGPVALKKVLGKGLFRYWPFTRFGAVR